MSTKFGKRAKRPPLSNLDKTLYGVLIALSVIIPLSLLIVIYIYDSTFLFADESIVASDSWFLLACMPIVLFVSLTLGILGSYGLRSRQPLFGNPNFVSKAFSPTLKVYPLFSKDFRESPERKKYQRTAIILLCLLVVFIFVSMLGFFPRETLDKSGTLRTHNMLNQVTHTEYLENADYVSFEIERNDNPKSRTHWYLRMDIYFEDTSYGFRLHNFAPMSTKEALHYMLSVKEQFKGRYELRNVEAIDKLMQKNYTSEERALIYELFDQ